MGGGKVSQTWIRYTLVVARLRHNTYSDAAAVWWPVTHCAANHCAAPRPARSPSIRPDSWRTVVRHVEILDCDATPAAAAWADRCTVSRCRHAWAQEIRNPVGNDVRLWGSIRWWIEQALLVIYKLQPRVHDSLILIFSLTANSVQNSSLIYSFLTLTRAINKAYQQAHTLLHFKHIDIHNFCISNPFGLQFRRYVVSIVS